MIFPVTTEPNNLEQAIQAAVTYSNDKYASFRLTFSAPISHRYTRRETDTLIVPSLHYSKRYGTFTYKRSRCPRSFWVANDKMTNTLKQIEVTGPNLYFDSFEEFRKQFSLKFISEDKIKKLWEGEPHLRSRYSFKRVTGAGREVFTRFLQKFPGIGKTNQHYVDTPPTLSEYHSTSRHMGRDISIRVTDKSDYVYYASEYMGCGNGSYYIAARPFVVLHVEDD